MFGKNVLRNEIRNLDEKIEKLEIELNKQTSLAKFLLNYNKEDVVASINYSNAIIFRLYELKVQYVYNNEIRNANQPLGENAYILESVENINDKVSVIKIKDSNNKIEYFYLDKVANSIFKITEFANYIANIGKKEEQKEIVVADKEKKIKKKVVANKETTSELVSNKSTTLCKFYDAMRLNLRVRDFKEVRRLDEKECATLLYLFDQYKYVDEIMKHIKLTKSSILTYAYILKNAGYLIFRKDMGRVANGCLIYNVGV